MKCYDTELSEGAKNDIGIRVMYMFNLARATQNEQQVEDHSWVSIALMCTSLSLFIYLQYYSLITVTTRSN
jgi:hypothetical protein